ncbi:cytochrome P450 [Streptomyces sp. NPDC059564]|uniref:cytochrome P450 n=1 Tax=Streptomyces sp. NPDC059564 TaxID=3346865 RepID=UPI0036A4092A
MAVATVPPAAPLGVIRRLHSRRGREDPFPLFEEIRSPGPVVSLGPYALVVTGYGECLHVLTDRNWQVPDEEWRTARGLASGYVTSRLMRTLPRLNGPQHGAARRLLSGPFTPAALVRLQPMVRELVRTHLDALAREVDQHGRAEFVDIVARALPTALMCAVLGLPDTDRTLIAQYSTQTAPLTEPFATPSQVTAAEAAAAEFHAYVLALLKDGTRRAGQGLLSRWAATGCPGSEPVDMDEFASHIVFLLGAGVETTSSLFATAVQALEQHPEQGRWLAAHPEAVPQAVEELIRWDPSVQNVVRVPAEDTSLAGFAVPAGTLVHALIAAANRDPAHFPSPGALDFRRRPQRNLAFGAGAHYCLGAALARLNANEFLPELARRFPSLRTDGPATRPSGLNLRTFTALPVTIPRPAQPTDSPGPAMTGSKASMGR